VFLIVVILLGVFFSMGYIVGRNSSPAGTDTARNEKAKNGNEADSPDSSTAEAPPEPAATPPASNPTTATASDSTPAPTTPEITKPEQSHPPPAKPAAAKAAESKPKPFPEPISAKTIERAPAAGEPSSGQYWQVVATSRPDAEIIAEALGKKGFHAVLAPAPKDGIFRVLVGPLADAPAQAQARTGLEAAGFKNPIMRKY